MGQRSETVRRANLRAVVRTLHLQGPQSRSELVAATGLTRSTIRVLSGELAEAGFVTERRAARSGSPGRPSPRVHLNPDGAVVLALDIAVDSLAASVIGLGGTILELERVDRRRGHASVGEVADDLAALARQVISRRPADDLMVGVGASIVGVVRRSDGRVWMAPNLGWRDVPLRAELVRALDTAVPVAIANDADLGALAEVRRGAARDAQHVIYIGTEVGVGGGLIVNGEPLTGVAGYAGEVGHIPVNPSGSACPCGSVGCWETEIGASALLRLAGRAPDGGRAELDAVVGEAERGSELALAAFEHVGTWLGVGLAGLVNVLNPDLIVLGGVLGRGLPYLSAAMDEALGRLALGSSRRLIRVIPGALGVDASIIGAAELAFEPLVDDPAAWLHGRPPGPASNSSPLSLEDTSAALASAGRDA